MINRESYCLSNQLVEVEANPCDEKKYVSGFHPCIDDISSRLVNNSMFTSFSHNIPSQVVGYVKYEPKETIQNGEALRFPPMDMSSPHYFVLCSRINDIIITKTLPQCTSHDYFIHGSH